MGNAAIARGIDAAPSTRTAPIAIVGKRRRALGLPLATSRTSPPIQTAAAATWTKSASAIRLRWFRGSRACPASVGADELEHRRPGGDDGDSRDRDRHERGRSADQSDDCGGLGHPAEPGRVGGRLDRQQPQPAGRDQDQAGANDRGLQPTPTGLEQDAPRERRPAGDQHAGDEQEPEYDRTRSIRRRLRTAWAPAAASPRPRRTRGRRRPDGRRSRRRASGRCRRRGPAPGAAAARARGRCRPAGGPGRRAPSVPGRRPPGRPLPGGSRRRRAA